MLKEPKTINPLLLLLVLGCIAMPQVNSNIGRMLRIPPAIVLQIESSKGECERYADLIFGFSPVKAGDEGWLLFLVPGSSMKIPDASRGFFAGSGQRRWELVLQMN
jgi:hypothetical protein